MVTAEQVKALRDATGVSMMQCKKALEEAGGDMEKATENLRAQGALIADKKSERALGAGAIGYYVHNNRTMGALVELACETDFVARNEEFVALAQELAMQVVAMQPKDVAELLSQTSIRDESRTVADMINSAIQKFGENTSIKRFVRLVVAQE